MKCKNDLFVKETVQYILTIVHKKCIFLKITDVINNSDFNHKNKHLGQLLLVLRTTGRVQCLVGHPHHLTTASHSWGMDAMRQLTYGIPPVGLFTSVTVTQGWFSLAKLPFQQVQQV